MNGFVKDYIEDYFQKNFIESYLLLPDVSILFKIDNVDKMKMEYFDNIVKNIQLKYTIDNIKNGDADLEINEMLNNFVDGYFTSLTKMDCVTLYDYIKNLLVKKGVNNRFSDDIFDHIVKSIVARVWPQYGKGRLNTDDFDHVINLVYNIIYNQYINVIGNKIDDLLNYKFDFMKFRGIKINRDKLKNYVSMIIFSSQEREFLRRINRLTINLNVELSRTGIELDKYVKQYFYLIEKREKNVDDVSEEKREDIKKIDSHNIVNTVSNLSNIRINSVKGEAVSNKIRANRGTGKVDKMVVTLSIIAILTINSFSINQYVDRLVNERNDMYAIQRVDMTDEFNYKWAFENGEYDKIAKNFIKVYSNREQVSDEDYKTLCIYDAYNSSSKLSEMDHVFNVLRKMIVDDNVRLNLRYLVNADSKQTYFYLDFIYDRLKSMGFEEVNSQEYQVALQKYKYANYGNQFGVVGVYMSNEDIKIISDVITKYNDCCKKKKLEFGYMLENESYDFVSSYSDTSRRGL